MFFILLLVFCAFTNKAMAQWPGSGIQSDPC